MLKVTTTHLKEGWLRRNGLPRSDRATLVEYWIRNDDYLTLVTVVKDPVYLTEPLVRTSDWVPIRAFSSARSRAFPPLRSSGRAGRYRTIYRAPTRSYPSTRLGMGCRQAAARRRARRCIRTIVPELRPRSRPGDEAPDLSRCCAIDADAAACAAQGRLEVLRCRATFI